MTKQKPVVLITFCVVLSCLMLLVGCGNSNPEEIIEKEISATFDALVVKEGESYDAMKTSFVEEFEEVPGINSEELFVSLLDGFNYSIDSIKVDNESGTAVATLNIKIKSMSDIFSAWLSDLSETDASTFNGMSEDEMSEYAGKQLLAAVDATEAKDATIEIRYSINKDGGWELAEGENLESLTEAMLGDLQDVEVAPDNKDE